MIRILIVDDHAAFREPLAFMFDREPRFNVIAHAGSISEVRNKLKEVDVAIVDLDLAGQDGVELVNDLREKNPDAMVLILTGNNDRRDFARAVEAGAAGVMHKSASIPEIIDAVDRLNEGELLISSGELSELLNLAKHQRRQAREIQQAINRLTPRELEILQELAKGLSNKEIAQRLYIQPETLRKHTGNILTKLNVHSKLEALVFAMRHGLVDIHP